MHVRYMDKLKFIYKIKKILQISIKLNNTNKTKTILSYRTKACHVRSIFIFILFFIKTKNYGRCIK